MSKDNNEDNNSNKEELNKLASKMEKVVNKAQKKQVQEQLSGKQPSNASSSAADVKKQAELRQQLQNMMKNLALMEQSSSSVAKTMGDHRFWNTQPVPQYGNHCVLNVFFYERRGKKSIEMSYFSFFTDKIEYLN